VNKIDPNYLINGRQLTNIGTFRAYIMNYIKSNPNIHEDMAQNVRQLPPCENGLPLELYAFAKETDWVKFEAIQADIFDHILAVVGVFELRIFQNPAGYDFRSRSNEQRQ